MAHANKGRKQSPEHVARRMAAMKARGVWPTGGGRPANTPENLWKKVDKRGVDECWPWLGFKNAQGYGRTWINDKGYYAHRVIFNLANPGVIDLNAPKDYSENGFIRHQCDNPICCNPRHLELGNHQDNMDDKVDRGRSILWEKSTDSPRAKLTAEDVFWIRMQKKYGATVKALAMLYDVSMATISGCLYGRHYQDVI